VCRENRYQGVAGDDIRSEACTSRSVVGPPHLFGPDLRPSGDQCVEGGSVGRDPDTYHPFEDLLRLVSATGSPALFDYGGHRDRVGFDARVFHLPQALQAYLPGLLADVLRAFLQDKFGKSLLPIIIKVPFLEVFLTDPLVRGRGGSTKRHGQSFARRRTRGHRLRAAPWLTSALVSDRGTWAACGSLPDRFCGSLSFVVASPRTFVLALIFALTPFDNSNSF
jgi:hypothetical protein